MQQFGAKPKQNRCNLHKLSGLKPY